MKHGSCKSCKGDLRMKPWELAPERFWLLFCPECGPIRVVVTKEFRLPLPESVKRRRAARRSPARRVA